MGKIVISQRDKWRENRSVKLAPGQLADAAEKKSKCDVR